MAGIYEWNPLPHRVAVRCPSCSGLATFEFAVIVEIKKADIEFFENSKLFEYRVFVGQYGQKWHGAVYYAGLHGGSTDAIAELPEGYTKEDWGIPNIYTEAMAPILVR